MRDQAIVRGITLRDFSTSFYLPRRSLFIFVSAVAILTAASLAGCHRDVPAEAKSTRVSGRLAALSLLPAETQIVLSIDVDRLRSQPVWRTLSSVLAKNAKPFLDDLAAGIGIEPMRQLHHIWIALPSQRHADGRFRLVAETDPLDTARAQAWLAARARDGFLGELPTPSQIAISKGGWTVAGATPRPASNAAGNPELRRLCERASGDHGIWFGALVPTSIRRTLMESGPMADVASLTRVFGFLDDTAGLHMELVGEFANTADPPLLAHRLKILHNQARRDPDVLVAGLSPYLEALRVETHDAHVRVSVDLPDTQADDVIERIEALALLARTKYSPPREHP
jgi:hypothetical protein